MSQNDSSQDDQAQEFGQLRDQQQQSIVAEFFQFITENKKWWLIPIVTVLGIVALLTVLGSTGAAPFIYTLF